MLRQILVAALVASCVAMPLAPKRPERTPWHALGNYTFGDYMREFERTYHAKEIPMRQQLVEQRLKQILAINADADMTWKAGINELTDRTTEEFRQLLGYNRHIAFSGEGRSNEEFPPVNVSALPTSIDWRTKGVVTKPKDQGGCGSCWAFSTAEVLESHIAIKTGKLLEFSEQEFVSCAPNPQHCGGTGGCEGSTQWLGFKYAVSAGITSESSYPYLGRDSACDKSKLKKVATITGYKRLPTNDYDQLMNAVGTVGPTAISVAAEPWMLYDHGVYNGNCGYTIDHAVVAVGYGADSGRPYWLVRNSWGPDWGEQGYIRIARSASAQAVKCGTDTQPGEGTACEGGPSTLKVCGLCGILSDSSYPTGGALAE